MCFTDEWNEICYFFNVVRVKFIKSFEGVVLFLPFGTLKAKRFIFYFYRYLVSRKAGQALTEPSRRDNILVDRRERKKIYYLAKCPVGTIYW
jgi:hypothetical protein